MSLCDGWVGIFSTPAIFKATSKLFGSQNCSDGKNWPALRFCRDQINSLRNGRDSDLKQIENAFKDPEDGFWERNSSEGIVGNSEVY